MRVVLTHAYSTTNSGDGLLVDEARSLVLQAFPAAQIDVIALDPNSFMIPGARVVHPITGTETTPTAQKILVAILRNALNFRSSHKRVDEMIRTADIVVAVGGGYLRGGNAAELLKTAVAHFSQLPTASRARNTRFVYLPQSIGPFPGPVWPFIRNRLKHSSRVYLRDDRSVSELGLQNTARRPDTAILGMDWRSISPRTTPFRVRTGVVARALGRSRRAQRYEAAILELAGRLDAEWLVQARARGNDDTRFYTSIGVGGAAVRQLRDAVSSPADSPDVVASVRLHGAIESLRSGVPAVHLSYERKGWGAFEDLDIAEYVHNVFDFDCRIVVAQAQQLSTDSSAYWQRIRLASTAISQAREEIVSELRSFALTPDYAN